MSTPLMAPTTPSSSFAPRKFGQPQTPAHLLQFAGYVVSNEGIARWGSRLTSPPHTFPAGASLVAAHEVHTKLKELNLAGLLNVGTLENPRFIVFTKNKVLPYRANMHESELAPLQADKWDKWTLKVMIQELHVDPDEVTAFKSVLSNDMPHDADVFGEVSRLEMEAWWREGPLN